MVETEERFSRLRFPVHMVAPDKDLEDTIPSLFRYKEFEEFKHSHKKELILYTNYLYDPGSDLIDEFPQDFQQRKFAAAIEAGIKRENDSWPEWFEKAMVFQKVVRSKKKPEKDSEEPKYDYEDVVDEKLVDMTLRFIRLFKNRIWTEICTLEVELERYTRQRWEGLKSASGAEDASSAVTSSKLSQICDSHIAKLNSLYGEFFNGDKDLNKAVLEMVSPENMDRLLT